MTDEQELDTLLLETLMAVVPNAGALTAVTEALTEAGWIDSVIATMLKGYGTLLCIIQAASELEGTMAERLSAGYYELTNTDPGGGD